MNAPMTAYPCPVCGAAAPVLDTVDFSKSCVEPRGTFLPRSGIGIDYALCDGCGFCFAPEIARWPRDEFAARIYNDDYHLVDPDYREARPQNNARFLSVVFGPHALDLRHLDYGGGDGQLSSALFADGWDSQSYDPFVDGDLPPGIGKFNLITCFEVFEHVPDVNDLMRTLGTLLADPGVVMFSTLTCDGSIGRGRPLDWWYASPRNGHISLFSRRSLELAGAKQGFRLVSHNPGLHMFWREMPAWATPLVTPASQA